VRKVLVTILPMKYRYVFVGVLLTLVAAVTVQGQEKSKDDATVSLSEKTEAQTLARRFTQRLQKTRDITPLIREFFPRDFAACFRQVATEDLDPQDKKRFPLTSNDILRGFAVGENITYVVVVASIYNRGRGLTKYDPVESAFPPRIQRKLDRLSFPFRLVDDDEVRFNRKKYLENVRQMETLLAEIHPYMFKKRLETSASFLKGLSEYPESNEYNVGTSVMDEETLCVRKGTKNYYVSTPIGLMLIMTRVKGNLEIYLASFPD
jgi:hypothetical protein